MDKTQRAEDKEHGAGGREIKRKNIANFKLKIAKYKMKDRRAQSGERRAWGVRQEASVSTLYSPRPTLSAPRSTLHAPTLSRLFLRPIESTERFVDLDEDIALALRQRRVATDLMHRTKLVRILRVEHSCL